MNPIRTLQAAWNEIPRVLPLMRNPSVPLVAKVAAAGAAVLIISPVDIFGWVPILGQIDDVVLLGYVVHLFVKFCERTLESSDSPTNVTPQANGAISFP